MNALSFEISGKSAIFKKPDVNSYAYFTYNNIHKPALLGILGAIIGLDGYIKLYDENIENKKNKKPLNDGFPEYYEKLKDLKISIIPKNGKEPNTGYFTKKIQTFNNSVGYASKELGGNLIVREQWLENPKWQILIIDNETKIYEKIKEYLLNEKAVFIPYLGKNDHPANIDFIEEINLESSEDFERIDSLFVDDYFEIKDSAGRRVLPFIFKELSPVSLQRDFHFYEYKSLIFTNQKLSLKSEYKNIYSFEDKNYFFF
ncbi:type I-B CRISPR-associated protein Cas5 [Halarcobacter mediterraneus]|uniref:Type I-B CRISPR-associated protein Cas5 n=1 Tax=Halarcobacter mediterraneus TaxID=2023153 RepID=A0A4Q1AVL8_9BACT|nr:type I-B CRISPR-associated protein Cas5b [Halarcobacter mediterraneus]RXK13496.1 type I-B CRISPR-associated protein Cas5 [Halarcobacter mediterraneus]